jgi:hypothetical protein
MNWHDQLARILNAHAYDEKDELDAKAAAQASTCSSSRDLSVV